MAADRRPIDRSLADPAAPADASELWRDRIPAGMLTILDGDPGSASRC